MAQRLAEHPRLHVSPGRDALPGHRAGHLCRRALGLARLGSRRQPVQPTGARDAAAGARGRPVGRHTLALLAGPRTAAVDQLAHRADKRKSPLGLIRPGTEAVAGTLSIVIPLLLIVGMPAVPVAVLLGRL